MMFIIVVKKRAVKNLFKSLNWYVTESLGFRKNRFPE